MIEKCWTSLADRPKPIRPGIWILLLVAVLTTIRAVQGFIHHHSGHRDEIANAIGSIGFIYGAPQPNHSGSRIIYLRTSEKGLAIFASDVATRQRQILQEWPGINFMDMHDQISPVSPDDSLFAYWFNASGEGPAGYLAFCRIDSGEEVARTDAHEYMNQMIWLSPSKLVWLGRKIWPRGGGGGYHLHIVEKRGENWPERILNFELTNAASLTAMSEDSFAWVDNKGLHQMNTALNSTATVFQPQGKQIEGCSYCSRTREFLLTCKEKNNDSLWRMKPGADSPATFDQLASDKDIENAAWISNGKGYAYSNKRGLVVKASVTIDYARLIEGTIGTIGPIQDTSNLFFLGAVSNTPWAGIP